MVADRKTLEDTYLGRDLKVGWITPDGLFYGLGKDLQHYHIQRFVLGDYALTKAFHYNWVHVRQASSTCDERANEYHAWRLYSQRDEYKVSGGEHHDIECLTEAQIATMRRIGLDPNDPLISHDVDFDDVYPQGYANHPFPAIEWVEPASPAVPEF